MPRLGASNYQVKSVPNKFNRLSVLILCLILTAAFTGFSIWYNLKKSDNIEQGLFNYISQKLQEGFESNNPIVKFKNATN